VRTRGAGEAALLLLDVVELLGAERIDYAVIGAMAASVHGLVRASVDADLVLSLPPPELSRLERLFAAAGFHTALKRGDAEDPIAAMLELTDRHDNRVGLLVGLRGLEAEAFARTIAVPFQGKMLRVIGREDFIAMKVIAHVPQEIADARNALAGSRGALDRPLVRRLATRYGRDAAAALEALLAAR
jgi:hypothetical protein